MKDPWKSFDWTWRVVQSLFAQRVGWLKFIVHMTMVKRFFLIDQKALYERRLELRKKVEAFRFTYQNFLVRYGKEG